MGSFSLIHWLVVLIPAALIFILRKPPAGPNRFGGLPEAMGFGQAISSYFKKYVDFSGRASRSEFWFSALFVVLVSIVLYLVDRTATLNGIWSLATFLPSIAMAARRFHDINRSGWHQLLGVLAPIGTIAVIVWYCRAPSVDDSRASVF
ncbi:DUF805 domain-containing protein [Rhizobium ruizarguesonis]|jgi:hypothetical protein|uniref:DUF805 domain-containing protein n=1 Tax=Rhizobium ruizarguesonis TaxID=2081791 RepID=A0AB38I2R2_9HYPH|nr:DUF805 domain-containing protein [Rhizobium ruizarguesonis]NEI05120.1 DUF805 domain-containing protein [Rhizobium ruizarguesonis]NEI28448.1 DUF805 domain-containing protein [Rhizobium ruizarguesonis]TAZ78955.1 DUF805 domain-containing protein [Rhizobium ruizarguesonis]TBA05330.1 DUF805 domain-containing protein [Rhizobium ruizarguesonis]TBA26763.1 DUF805 domain-containing protein [Rhizobium ruizarguesonis]